MARRRIAPRKVYLHLPTHDGRRVAVRSHTVAQRLVLQAEAIDELSRLGREVAGRLEWAEERFRRIHRHPLVALLCRLRIVRPAPEQRPEGWAAPAQASVPSASMAPRAGSADAPKGLASPGCAPTVDGATPSQPPVAPPAQNGRWVP